MILELDEEMWGAVITPRVKSFTDKPLPSPLVTSIRKQCIAKEINPRIAVANRIEREVPRIEKLLGRAISEASFSNEIDREEVDALALLRLSTTLPEWYAYASSFVPLIDHNLNIPNFPSFLNRWLQRQQRRGASEKPLELGRAAIDSLDLETIDTFLYDPSGFKLVDYFAYSGSKRMARL